MGTAAGTAKRTNMMLRQPGICYRAAPALVLVLLLLAGCASLSPAEQLHAAVEETMLDEDRRADMQALSDEYLGLLDQLVEELEAGRKTLDGLVADYGSDREQFDTFFAEYAEVRSKVADRAIEVHLAMKEIATAEEWGSLEKATQAVTTAMLSEGLATVSGEE